MLSLRDEEISVLPPPPGIIPNFVDPPSRAHVIVISNSVCTVISALFMALRVYTAIFITRCVYLDDYVLIGAWILALVYSILNVINTKFGMGHHIWDVTFSTLNPRFMQVGAISGSFFGLSIMLTKLSILTLFLRFVTTGGKLRRIIQAMRILVVLYTVVGYFDWVYSCRPQKKYWDLTVTGGSCIYWLKISVFSCVMNTVTDVVILILPAFMLRNLHVPKKQKIGVILVLMTGGFVLVITVIKLKLTVDLASKTDITWEIVTSNTWWALELHLAIVCACLPTLKPFLRKHAPMVIGSSYGRSNGTRGRTTFSITSHQPGDTILEPEEIILESHPYGRSTSKDTMELGRERAGISECASDRGLMVTNAKHAAQGEQ